MIEKMLLTDKYDIPKMGTSGLRLTQEKYNQAMFLEQFAQGLADFFLKHKETLDTVKNSNTLLIGGDPRKGNADRIKRMAEICAARGFHVKVARDGLASTPSMSHAIRELEAAGGIVLTASHNPFTDVGIKVNMSDGSPALDETVAEIQKAQNSVSEIMFISYDTALENKKISEFDSIALYADLLDKIFNFNKIKDLLNKRPIRAIFDSMNGAAGPYAHEIFINRLGIDATILHEEPREDLGGFDSNGEPKHPEPDFSYIPELMKENSTGNYDLVGAWDSDVDRRLDGGSGVFLESADEFTLFARYSSLIGIESLFQKDIYFCRSTVTAATIDLMKEELSELYPNNAPHVIETPTGFKWIADLGNWGVEESNGVGNPYLREKDGIFATLFLLKIILETGKKPLELMEEIWEKHGRVYFTRGEVSGSDMKEKDQLTTIFNNASNEVGKEFGSLVLEKAESWAYTHPVQNEVMAENAAWVLSFSQGNTIKARFSGTGSSGYTLRIYCSKFDKDYAIKKSTITQPMKDAFDAFLTAQDFPGKGSHYTDEHQPDPYE